MSAIHDKVLRVISKPPEKRSSREIQDLEGWFQRKAKILDAIPKESLNDIIKYCDFLAVARDHVIVKQGDKPDTFYIILRGKVTVLSSEADDVTDSDHVTVATPRDELGSPVMTLEAGQSFGQLALESPDVDSATSVVADQDTEMIVISRDLYSRCLAAVVARDFHRKVTFINRLPLLATWSARFRRHLANVARLEKYGYDDEVFRQGAPVDAMSFIYSGGVRLVADPESHRHQFKEILDRCDRQNGGEQEPLFSLANWLSVKSRTTDRLLSRQTTRAHDATLPGADYRHKLSPSAKRKGAERAKSSRHVNICILQEEQVLGDLECLLDMPVRPFSAICTHPTTLLTFDKAVFHRLFRRYNPVTMTTMARNLTLHLESRVARCRSKLRLPLLMAIIAGVRKVAKSGEVTSLQSQKTAVWTGSDKLGGRVALSLSRSDGQRRQARGGGTSQCVPWRAGVPMAINRMTVTHVIHGPARRIHPVAARVRHSMAHAHPVSSFRQLDMAVYGRATRLETHRTVTAGGDSSPRDGIYLKLLQLHDPDAAQRLLEEDQDAYAFLCQLRMRMSREFPDLATTPLSSRRGRRRGPSRGMAGGFNVRSNQDIMSPEPVRISQRPRTTAESIKYPPIIVTALRRETSAVN